MSVREDAVSGAIAQQTIGAEKTHHQPSGSSIFSYFNFGPRLQQHANQQPKLISWSHMSHSGNSRFLFDYSLNNTSAKIELDIPKDLTVVSVDKPITYGPKVSAHLFGRPILIDSGFFNFAPIHQISSTIAAGGVIAYGLVSKFRNYYQETEPEFYDGLMAAYEKSLALKNSERAINQLLFASNLIFFGLPLAYCAYSIAHPYLRWGYGKVKDSLYARIDRLLKYVENEVNLKKFTSAQMNIKKVQLLILLKSLNSPELKWRYHYIKGKILAYYNDVHAAEKELKAALTFCAEMPNAVTKRHLSIKALVNLYCQVKEKLRDQSDVSAYEDKIISLLQSFPKEQYSYLPQELQKSLASCLNHLKKKEFEMALTTFQAISWDVFYEYLYPTVSIYYYKIYIILLLAGQSYSLSASNPWDVDTRKRMVQDFSEKIANFVSKLGEEAVARNMQQSNSKTALIFSEDMLAIGDHAFERNGTCCEIEPVHDNTGENPCKASL